MKQFFAESDGNLSMKRLCGFICVVALAVTLVHKPSETVIISVATLAGAALGMTSAEKIFKRK
jgi:hypothetical protein